MDFLNKVAQKDEVTTSIHRIRKIMSEQVFVIQILHLIMSELLNISIYCLARIF